jgi:DnaJ-class molecular chaperone
MLAKKYHPDLNKGNDAKFKEITLAYEILKDKNIK